MAVFGSQLRVWRLERRISQQELSLRSGVSERHISFLETGRSRPSARVVEKLAEALDVPLRERNELHASAGLFPLYPVAAEDDEMLEPFRRAVKQLLISHEPYPASVLDRWWRVIDANETGRAMGAALDDGPADAVEAMLAPDSPAREMVENYAEVAWGFYRRLRADVALMAGDARLAELFERATACMADIPEPDPISCEGLIISPRLKLPNGRVIPTATMIARFGAAREVGIGELQVELMFPLDAEGEAYFAQLGRG